MKPQDSKQPNQNNGPQYSSDFGIFCICSLLGYGVYKNFWEPLSGAQKAYYITLILLFMVAIASIATFAYLNFFSKAAKEAKALKEKQNLVPNVLKKRANNTPFLGSDKALEMDVYLPDQIRSRHVHIIGASGSGKTVSTILNLIDQDISNGHPIIILDAKGDADFLSFLNSRNLGDRLKIFDFGATKSPCCYNPTKSGTPSEAAARLFNSLTWSQDYFKAKARRIVKRFFEAHFSLYEKNPTLEQFNDALSDLDNLNQATQLQDDDKDKGFVTTKDYEDLSGLIDQVDQLSSGHLKRLLSPEEGEPTISLEKDIKEKKVVYFRLQSMLDSESIAVVSKMVINELANCAAYAQRKGDKANFCPVFLDEFASFVCSPFVEVISKARSAGFALHFSHQSMGNVLKHGPEFVSEIVDNSSTRIVMRTYDPDTTEFLAQCFGSIKDTKFTHKIEGSADNHTVADVGSLREVQAFAVNPSDIKSLPTGEGFVFIAHGINHMGSGANVFRLSFPNITEEKTNSNQPNTERNNK